jgi:VIT1/CCC1 family predicted Fe2+/Mn2+ transporter
MPVVRAVVLLLLVAAGVTFVAYALTGNARYRRLGLRILLWTLLAVFLFFVALFIQRLAS